MCSHFIAVLVFMQLPSMSQNLPSLHRFCKEILCLLKGLSFIIALSNFEEHVSILLVSCLDKQALIATYFVKLHLKHFTTALLLSSLNVFDTNSLYLSICVPNYIPSLTIIQYLITISSISRIGSLVLGTSKSSPWSKGLPS